MRRELRASLVCLTAFCSGNAFAQFRLPSFKCGPGLLTYWVKANDGRAGSGVRCVKFANKFDVKPVIYWYGEGAWGSTKYRHLGWALGWEHGAWSGLARDFYGNGEQTNGAFDNLRITASDDSMAPARITVTGQWNETWERAPGGSVLWSALPPVKVCGPQFKGKFSVRDLNGARSGSGVRCSPEANLIVVWFGEGTWGGTRYAHLGYVDPKGYGAADICESKRSDTCGNFAPNTLKLDNYLNGGWKVTGSWSEIWDRLP